MHPNVTPTPMPAAAPCERPELAGSLVAEGVVVLLGTAVVPERVVVVVVVGNALEADVGEVAWGGSDTLK